MKKLELILSASLVALSITMVVVQVESYIQLVQFMTLLTIVHLRESV